MKKINLISRLLSYSHEKQSPQRFGRFAVMLIMLLIIGVGQMWGTISQRIIFFKPSPAWKQASAYFDIHYWQNSNSDNNGDVTMTESNNSGVYYAYIPDWADRVLFYRRNPSGGGEWAKTGDQTVENWYGQCNMTATGNDDWSTTTSWESAVWWNAYTVYYDDTETGFTSGVSTPKLRVGTTSNTTKDDMTLVTGTNALYKHTKTGGNWEGYHAFCFANAAGSTGGDKSIYDRGSGDYNITKQTEYIRGSLKGDFTFIGHSAGSYYHNDDKCTYYSTEIYYGIKKYRITNTSVEHATVELYYWDPSNTKQIVSEGSYADVLPTTKVWCKVTPDEGYAVPKVMLSDPDEREWTDASNESSGRNLYIVRKDVTFRAVVEPLATKTILIKDVNSWAPNMYFKGWNPFQYEGYNNNDYYITTQKVSTIDKVHLCDADYYAVTFTNEFPFYYIHNEGEGNRTAFFTYSAISHMNKYDNSTEGDGNWGLHDPNCSAAIYWVETLKGTKHYISNVVGNTTDTLSFYAESGSTVEFHASNNPAVDVYSTIIAPYFNSGRELNGKTGAVFTARTNGSTLTNDTIYDGDYEIHVNATTENYLINGESRSSTTGKKFIKFEKNSLFGDDYDHYWVDWFPSGGVKSVVATVGNKYNANLAGVLGSDEFAPKGMTKSTGGNVRYGYNPETNYFKRAIIDAGSTAVQISSSAADNVMISNDGGSTYTQDASSTTCYLADATNWNYQAFAKVKGTATATAKTSYVTGTQTMASNKKLIGGDSGTDYVVVITYDFKTNRFIAAWKPGDSFEGFQLESNLMVVRTEDGRPTVLNIVDGADEGTDVTPLSKITKIYTVIELLQDNWKRDEATYADNPYAKRRIVDGIYTDEYYWISLPYECLVSDIFGIEGYGSEGSWVLQTYRGDLRAEKGWWAETNAWWYDLDRTDTLKANVGYVLRVTNLNGDHGDTKRFAGDSGGKLYLYFPSEANDTTIGPLTETVTTTLDSLKCTKWHKRPKEIDPTEGENNPIWDRRAIDSNWRIIGSPSFNSAKISTPDFWSALTDLNTDGVIDYKDLAKYLSDNKLSAYSLKYFYDWEVEYKGEGEYETKFTVANASTSEFIGTHAHLVQYVGDITWVAYNGSNPLVGLVPNPAAAPARKNDNEQTLEQTLRLVLKIGEKEADVAYISRMLFGATTGYDVNMDLSKMTNANTANIYTYGDLYKMAGNCIPDTVETLAVGLQLATEGIYTFAMPEGTYGTGVTLLDKVTGESTNLALTDYTVNLAAGTYDERFVLQLSPIAQTPTEIEAISNQYTDIRKVVVDGVLYIVKDGVVFDAQGNRVK